MTDSGSIDSNIDHDAEQYTDNPFVYRSPSSVNSLKSWIKRGEYVRIALQAAAKIAGNQFGKCECDESRKDDLRNRCASCDCLETSLPIIQSAIEEAISFALASNSAIVFNASRHKTPRSLSVNINGNEHKIYAASLTHRDIVYRAFPYDGYANHRQYSVTARYPGTGGHGWIVDPDAGVTVCRDGLILDVARTDNA